MNIQPKQISLFFKRTFRGRLNRSAYLSGILVLVFIVWTALKAVAAPLIFILGPIPAAMTLLIIFTVITNFYLASFQVRRLHDINKSGFFVLSTVPYTLYSTINIGIYLLSATGIHMPTFPAIATTILQVYGYMAGIVLLLLLFLPGAKTDTRYGPPLTRWPIKEVFGLHDTAPVTDAADPNKPVPPSTSTKLAKVFFKIFLILAAIVAIVLVLASFAPKA